MQLLILLLLSGNLLAGTHQIIKLHAPNQSEGTLRVRARVIPRVSARMIESSSVDRNESVLIYPSGAEDLRVGISGAGTEKNAWSLHVEPRSGLGDRVLTLSPL